MAAAKPAIPPPTMTIRKGVEEDMLDCNMKQGRTTTNRSGNWDRANRACYRSPPFNSTKPPLHEARYLSLSTAHMARINV